MRKNSLKEINEKHKRINGDLREQLKATEKLALEYKKKNDAVKTFIFNHYDLGSKENIEFCYLRDKLLEILGSDKNERKD